jgi:hypothetical protein
MIEEFKGFKNVRKMGVIKKRVCVAVTGYALKP